MVLLSWYSQPGTGESATRNKRSRAFKGLEAASELNLLLFVTQISLGEAPAEITSMGRFYIKIGA